MTLSERRLSPRFSPNGLTATIRLESEVFQQPIFLEGVVVDISFTGIKIRLKTPSASEMAGKIRIDLFLPDTGIPFSISGILRHENAQGDLGIEYVDTANLLEMDKFMFICTKLAKNDRRVK